MLKYFFIIFALLMILVLSITGFRGAKSTRPPIEIFPDMRHQPKVKAQVPSSFFADGRGNRLPVPGSVPMGYAAPLHKPVDGSHQALFGKEILCLSVPQRSCSSHFAMGSGYHHELWDELLQFRRK